MFNICLYAEIHGRLKLIEGIFGYKKDDIVKLKEYKINQRFR